MKRLVVALGLLFIGCTGDHGRECYDDQTCGDGLVCIISRRPPNKFGPPVATMCVAPEIVVKSTQIRDVR